MPTYYADFPEVEIPAFFDRMPNENPDLFPAGAFSVWTHGTLLFAQANPCSYIYITKDMYLTVYVGDEDHNRNMFDIYVERNDGSLGTDGVMVEGPEQAQKIIKLLAQTLPCMRTITNETIKSILEGEI